MPYLLVRHRVNDYATWKPVFDEHGATRQRFGFRGEQLFCTADDPNHVLILFEVDDLNRAREFAESEDLRDTMQRAGVADRPDLYFLEEVG